LADPSEVLDHALDAQPDSAPGAVAHCPLKDKGPAPPPKPKNPCSGLGMSDDKKEKAFAADAKKLQKDWKKLSVDERQARIKTLANSALPPGFPEVGVFPLKDSTNAGSLDFKNWRLELGDKELAKNTMSDAEANEFADTVYHETRHAEQWYLMAQKLAAEGKTADEIQNKLKIPKTTAEAAKKDPLKKDDPRQACADALYDSVYGTKRDYRNKVLTDLETKSAAVDKAQKAYEDLKKDKTASKKKIEDANKAWVDAYNDYQKTKKDYMNLPEEADAWETAGAMKKNL